MSPVLPETAPCVSRIQRRRDQAPLVLAAGVSRPTPHLPTAEMEVHAFATACWAHRTELLAAAVRLTRAADTAEDLVAETILRAIAAREQFAAPANLRAWLYRILTNAFINGYRKRRRHQRFSTERPHDVEAALFDVEQAQGAALADGTAALSDEVLAALATLEPEYRAVVEAADLRGERYREIADAQNIPIGTVMSRLFRARRLLARKLGAFAAATYGVGRMVAE